MVPLPSPLGPTPCPPPLGPLPSVLPRLLPPGYRVVFVAVDVFGGVSVLVEVVGTLVVGPGFCGVAELDDALDVGEPVEVLGPSEGLPAGGLPPGESPPGVFVGRGMSEKSCPITADPAATVTVISVMSGGPSRSLSGCSATGIEVGSRRTW